MNTKQSLAALVIVATASASLTGFISLIETASGQNATGGNATTAATATAGPVTSEGGQGEEGRYDEGWE